MHSSGSLRTTKNTRATECEPTSQSSGHGNKLLTSSSVELKKLHGSPVTTHIDWITDVNADAYLQALHVSGQITARELGLALKRWADSECRYTWIAKNRTVHLITRSSLDCNCNAGLQCELVDRSLAV